jgi:hypothetical protein
MLSAHPESGWQQKVSRLFNGKSGGSGEPNHRYVTNPATTAEMTKRQWILEASAFCVPNDAYTRTFAR